jgi:hypothetical protein
MAPTARQLRHPAELLLKQLKQLEWQMIVQTPLMGVRVGSLQDEQPLASADVHTEQLTSQVTQAVVAMACGT